MVWFSFDEHIFGHSWEKVVEAALRKYPNPETPNVSSTDVYERSVDKEGNLHSKRVISSVWQNAYTNLLSKLVGIDITKTVHAIEFSVLDPKKKSFELTSRNYNFLDYVVVDEKLIYTPHPVDSSSTLLRQEWHITCKNISFKGFMENAMGTTMVNASVRGRQGIEYVIGQVKEEVERFASSSALEMQNIASNTMREFSSIQQSFGDFGKKFEENLQEEINEFMSKSGQA